MENRDHKKRKGKKKLLSWLLIAVMLLTSVNIQAAEEDVFTDETDSFGVETMLSEEAGETETEEIKIVFADGNGKEYESLTVNSALGDSIILPGVPGYENVSGSGWKLEKDVADTDAVVLSAKSSFLLDSGEEYVMEHIINGVLTLYAVPGVYTVNFYSNSGAGNPLKSLKVSPGTVIKLPDIKDSRYVNFGWTDTRGGTAVKYKLGASYKVNKNTNLFIIRYAASKVRTVTYAGPTGATNTQFRALTTNVLSGTRVKLPAVPALTGYTCLGWSTKKNAATAAYTAGQTITVTKNITLYAVRRKLTSYSVTFNNNSGTSTSKAYTALNKKINKGEYITLPNVPKASGYVNLGWTTTKKGTTATYKAGSKVKVTKNLKFYAVRKKEVYYTAAFYTGSGSAGSAYKALNKKVLSGTTITLPSVPARSGYTGLGWSTKKNASSAGYKAGAKLKITKNVKLYAVQKKSATVVLHQNSGSVWKTYTLAEGSSLTLPGVKNKTNYTMMGWSKSSGKKVSPDYEVGTTLKNIKGTIHLYAVVFDRRKEPSYSADDLPQADLRKFKQIIFVGDSRTNRMATTLERLGDTTLTNGITFISKEGGGLSWLQSTGYKALLKQVGNGSSGILQKKTAVVFNLGVNDLSKSYSYVTYMRSIAAELKAKGCTLFYMSVNPVNYAMIKALGKNALRKESAVRSFNSVIKSNLCSGSSKLYTYVDSYGYLMKNGFGTDMNRYGQDEGVDDGLHYTTKTYKRIYKFCMGEISK
ncbi:MAG: InlB B-repeat-containing protein [Eubacteriales bacterium]|nr:InlB B-repeat-containing protein [Eubacteriales bacterium]